MGFEEPLGHIRWVEKWTIVFFSEPLSNSKRVVVHFFPPVPIDSLETSRSSESVDNDLEKY